MNNSYLTAPFLKSGLTALYYAIECSRSQSQTCICPPQSNCFEVRNLLNHTRNCDSGAQCGYPNCGKTLHLMRHFINCQEAQCFCAIINNHSKNRFSFVIKDILLKNQFLFWRRKMEPSIRRRLINEIIDFLIDFCDFDWKCLKENIFGILSVFEEELFLKSHGISIYLSSLAKKINEILSEVLIIKQRKMGIDDKSIFIINQEENMGKIYEKLRSFSTGVLLDQLQTNNLEEVDKIVEKIDNNFEKADKNELLNQNIVVKLEKSISDNREMKIDSLSPGKTISSIKNSESIIAVVKTKIEEENHRKLWTNSEIEELFLPLHKQISKEKDAEPFLYPVDWVAWELKDYPNIVTNPMDLSTIFSKLTKGDYDDPWKVIEDYWLMFNNAWLYNKKTSKIYKSCTNLAKQFEGLADDVMKSVGLCCGRDYVYLPQVLICCTTKMCTVNRDSVYYYIDNNNNNNNNDGGGKIVENLSCDKYICCDKCFSDNEHDKTVELMVSESISTVVSVEKKLFTKSKNNIKEKEEFVECRRCHRQWHRVCAGHVDEIWRSGFYCQCCEQYRPHARHPNTFTAANLPHCELSKYIESKLDSWRDRQPVKVSKIVVRVLSVSDKTVEIREEVKKAFVDTGEMPETLPYRLKAIFAFQELEDGSEVCLFGMHTQEYSSDSADPNSRRIYLAYLDSVNFFEPRTLRTDFYHRLLISYFEYCRNLGFMFAHIWACPPGEGDDFIFHMHPPHQKIPKPKRLQDWYIAMLDLAVKEESIIDYHDIFSYSIHSKLSSVTELPYFEGDYWTTVLEDLLKEDSNNNNNISSIEQFMNLNGDNEDDDDDEYNTTMNNDNNNIINNYQNQNSKKRKLKKLPINSKRKKYLDQSDGDITQRVFDLIEKRKENFFVLRLLNSTDDRSKKPIIIDEDDLKMTNKSELMDGRDRFLSLSREKHLEFSSLRRAMFATRVLCYELHLELRQGVIYSCNHCDILLDGVRFTCTVCHEFEMCEQCEKKQGHEHQLQRYPPLDRKDEEVRIANESNHREKLRQLQEGYAHAALCRDANCRKKNCNYIRPLMNHSASCLSSTKGCRKCQFILELHKSHIKQCNNNNCQLPHCVNTRRNSSSNQNRLLQLTVERRRMDTSTVEMEESLYKTEISFINRLLNNWKSEPGMTQEKLKRQLQEVLNSNVRYREAFDYFIKRQQQKQQQQQQSHVAVTAPAAVLPGHLATVARGAVGTQQQTQQQYYMHPQQQQHQQFYNNQNAQFYIVPAQPNIINNPQQQQQQQQIYYNNNNIYQQPRQPYFNNIQ